MSDVPRKLFRAKELKGERQGQRILHHGICVLAFLWCDVYGNAKKAGGPHFVPSSITGLSFGLDLGERQVSAGVTSLANAGLCLGAWVNGQFGYWLHTPPGAEDPHQSPDRCPENDDSSAASDANAQPRGRGDRRSNSPQSDRRSPGDRRSLFGRSSIETDPPKEEQLTKQLTKQEREQETRARALAAILPPVAGASPLGQSRHDLRRLVDLLEGGEPPELIERVLRRAPELVARGMQAARYLNSEMFAGGIWASWKRSLVELEALELADAKAAAAATEAAAQASKRAEREAAEREAESLRELVADLRRRAEHPRELTPLERHLAAQEPAERARLLAPAVALEAALAALARGVNTLAELRTVLATLPAARLPTPEEELAQVRAARLARTPTTEPEPEPEPATKPTREELIDRRARLSDEIRAALADGHDQLASELAQARLELSRELHRLDTQPFGGRAADALPS